VGKGTQRATRPQHMTVDPRNARDCLEHETVAQGANFLRLGEVGVEDEEREDLGGAAVVGW